MRVSRLSLTFFTLFTSFTAYTLASPTTECLAEYCPINLEPRQAPFPTAAPLPVAAPLPAPPPTPTSQLTNAGRIAQGLPIKPPSRRTRAARKPVPSPAPRDTKHGVIKVTDSGSGAILGYISRNSLGHAQYRYQPRQDDALVVEFAVNIGPTSTCDIRITTKNSDTPGFPLLALIQGRDDSNTDLSPRSYHYAYVGGMAEPGSPPNSVPLISPTNSYSFATGLTRAAESDVWCFDTNTSKLTPRWTNQDSSKPGIRAFAQSTAIYVSADVPAFFDKYPAPVHYITFSFISL